MEPALDRQRHQFVAELTGPATAKITPSRWLATAWRELFAVYRRAWLGLAAVWLIIGGLQFTLDEPPAVAHLPLPPLPPPAMQDGIDYLYAFGHRTSGNWPDVPRQPMNRPPAEPKPPGPRGDSPLDNFGFWLGTQSGRTEPQSA